MRKSIVLFVILGLALCAGTSGLVVSTALADQQQTQSDPRNPGDPLLAQGQPPAGGGDSEIDVTVRDESGARWYADPVWIVVGIVVAVLIVALIAMLARGGGSNTTVIRE